MFFTTLVLALAVFSTAYGDEIPIDDCGKHALSFNFFQYLQPAWHNALYRKEEAMHYICYLLLRFTPGYVRRHRFHFNSPPRDQVYADSVRGAAESCWRPYSVGLLHSEL
jgi:hypothetical protein